MATTWKTLKEQRGDDISFISMCIYYLSHVGGAHTQRLSPAQRLPDRAFDWSVCGFDLVVRLCGKVCETVTIL